MARKPGSFHVIGVGVGIAPTPSPSMLLARCMDDAAEGVAATWLNGESLNPPRADGRAEEAHETEIVRW